MTFSLSAGGKNSEVQESLRKQLDTLRTTNTPESATLAEQAVAHVDRLVDGGKADDSASVSISGHVDAAGRFLSVSYTSRTAAQAPTTPGQPGTATSAPIPASTGAAPTSAPTS